MPPRHHLIKLDYEPPDEDRPALGISPIGQIGLGIAVYVVVVFLAVFFIALWGRASIVTLATISIGIGASIWAHVRWRWYEFTPAIVVCVAITLIVVPIVGFVAWLCYHW